MTSNQRRATKLALYRHGVRFGRGTTDREAWEKGITQAVKYYNEHDKLRADLMSLRYFERCTEEETIDRLQIGKTTYQKANADVLSTVAVYAARYGAEV